MADSPSELQFEIEKLERKHAENPEGRFFVPLANAYRKMGDVETAEALLRAGVERHPDYLSAHIVLGRCLADRGAVGEAEEEFRFVLSQDPQNLIALRTLGELAVSGGRPSEAAEWYRELLAVDPMNEDARQALDALSDAPAADAEAEFRSGAGWWESGSDEAPAAAETSDDQFEPAPLEGLSGSGGEETAGVPEAPAAYEPEKPVQDFEPAPLEGLSGSAAFDESDSEPRPDEEAFADDFQRFGEPALEPSDTPSFTSPLLDGADEVGGGFGRDEYYGGEELPGLRADEATAPLPDLSDPSLVSEEQASAAYDSPDPGELPGLRADQVATPSGSDWSLQDEGNDEDDGGARYTDEGSSEVVTETIAELYARQGLHERAASVYRELIRRRGGDPALERRLAEIERLAVQDDQTEQGLSLADDEALVTPPVDAEDDPFAATFENGFTTEFDEHPLPELAPDREEPEPSEVPPAGGAAGASIAQLLAGLASWRPVAPPRIGSSAAEAAESSPFAGETAEATPSVMEPWEEQSAGAEEAAADLPYLEEAAPSSSADGTRSAEEEPFPWELPGGESPSDDWEEPEAPEATATGLDPFFIDDVEPVGMRSDEPLPEASPPPPREAREEPAPGPRTMPGDPTEDEDLESFQAWLRSLKR